MVDSPHLIGSLPSRPTMLECGPDRGRGGGGWDVAGSSRFDGSMSMSRKQPEFCFPERGSVPEVRPTSTPERGTPGTINWVPRFPSRHLRIGWGVGTGPGGSTPETGGG